MNAPQPTPQEIQAALEDVRRIRTLVQRGQDSRPLWLVMKPLYVFAIVAGPVVAAFAIGAQLIVDHPASRLAGLTKPALLGIMGGLLVALSAGLKSLIAAAVSRREGLELSRVLREVFSRHYFRTALPIITLTAAAAASLHQGAQDQAIAGLVSAAFGALLITAPLVVPVRGATAAGLFALLGGVTAMFVLPAYPFYKVAVIWGVALSAVGIMGRRQPDPDEDQE